MEARKRWKPNFFFSRGLRTIALTAVIFSALQSALGSAKVGGGSIRANSITIKVSTELQVLTLNRIRWLQPTRISSTAYGIASIQEAIITHRFDTTFRIH
jgi:hypothetical protein